MMLIRPGGERFSSRQPDQESSMDIHVLMFVLWVEYSEEWLTKFSRSKIE